MFKGLQPAVADETFISFVKERDSLGRLLKRKDSPRESSGTGIRSGNTSPVAKFDDLVGIYFKPKLTMAALKPMRLSKKCSLLLERLHSMNRTQKTNFPLVHVNPEPIDTVNSKEELQKMLRTRLPREAAEQGRKGVEIRFRKVLLTTQAEEDRPVSKLRKRKGSSRKMNIDLCVTEQNPVSRREYISEKYLNCPQLSRYNQMKRMSSQIQEDFEEGHMRFLNRIREGKMLAYRIKEDLEK